MYKITTKSHLEELLTKQLLPQNLLTIIHQEITWYCPLLCLDASNEVDPQITLLILINDEEFLTLVSAYQKPEYVEKLPIDESEICKLCFMLDNECTVFAYVAMSETVAEWLHEEVE